MLTQWSKSLYEFLSTPSARRATAALPSTVEEKVFLSTPSARRATRIRPPPRCPAEHFYPRPPRGGRRSPPAQQAGRGYFYPRPPRGGRLGRVQLPNHLMPISIHALREEGDAFCVTILPSVSDFYPRPPRGGRLGGPARPLSCGSISIHALREEGDIHDLFLHKPIRISIHALREEGDQPKAPEKGQKPLTFLSTPSARRATTFPARNP